MTSRAPQVRDVMGGHGFDSCGELRFFLSHARVMLISSLFTLHYQAHNLHLYSFINSTLFINSSPFALLSVVFISGQMHLDQFKPEFRVRLVNGEQTCTRTDG